MHRVTYTFIDFIVDIIKLFAHIYIYICNAAIANQTAGPNWLTLGANRLESHIG